MDNRHPRWLTATAVVGALAAGTLGGRVLLHRQAAVARRLIGKPLGEDALDADRTYKKKYRRRDGRAALDLVVLGDSIAAGLGAGLPKQTLGARLSTRLAKATRRSVRLRTVARVGSESSALAAQVATLPPTYRPHVAVVVVGGNDVTHRIPTAESVRHLQSAMEQLQARGCAVVVGTCPDLGALVLVPQPLRRLASRASRQLARAQQEAAVHGGAYAVSLADVVGPFFVGEPDEMFSLDRFHPSALGYRRTADALLPSVLAALGEQVDELPPGHHPPRPEPERRRARA